MIATSHALTGAAIAVIVKKPYLVIPLSFLSHFVCDMFPHFGIGMEFGAPVMFIWLLLDGLAIILFALFFSKKGVQNLPLLAAGAIAAMAPDLMWMFYGLIGHDPTDPITKFHSAIQWFEHPIGLVFDIAWISLMTWIILRFGREDHQDSATSQA